MFYITLDNVDGKQARRTGTSSPLGQMFDHGCDALTFNLSIITVCRIHQLSSGYLNFLFVSLAPIGYFLYNIREYYLGEYYLPFINPISEGSLLEFVVCCLISFYGWEAVKTPILFEYTALHYFSIFFIVFQTYQNFEIIVKIITSKNYEMKYSLNSFLVNFSSYWVLFIL